MRTIREKWTASGIESTCVKCGAKVDIVSTGDPYQRGVVVFRCINEACEASNKWSVIKNGSKDSRKLSKPS